MTMTVKTCTRIAATLTFGAFLAGCNYNTANDAVRGGPQAVHPSPSALAQRGSAPATGQVVTASVSSSSGAVSSADAEVLFAEFCLDKPNTAATEAVIQQSGRFGAPLVSENGASRTATYPLVGDQQASITVASGSPSGLLCSVNVNDSGPSLFLNGTVTRD